MTAVASRPVSLPGWSTTGDVGGDVGRRVAGDEVGRHLAAARRDLDLLGDDAADDAALEAVLERLAERRVEVRADRALRAGAAQGVAGAALLDEDLLARDEIVVELTGLAAARTSSTATRRPATSANTRPLAGASPRRGS